MNWLPRQKARQQKVKPDDHSEVVPLLPIPNRTVKRLSADDSAGSRVKVGHCQANNKKQGPGSAMNRALCHLPFVDVLQGRLHTAPILAADLEEGIGDLSKAATAHRIHQHSEDIAVVDDRGLKSLEHRRCFG
jgi:hypothetical protein